MEVLRVPPYPITTKWDVPSANTAYSVYVEDLVDHSSETTTLTSDANKQISYVLPRSKVQFDRDFLFQVKDSTGEIVVDDNLTVYRPYVNPNNLATTAQEIAEYKNWEIIARSIMDNYLDNSDFYNHKLVIVKEGQGGDYFPIWHNPKRILKVYENNTLVYDYDTRADWEQQYIIAPNNSAIMRVIPGTYNRFENSPVGLPMAAGDLQYYGKTGMSFPKGFDYTFVLDVGYKAVPPDIEIATKMLIEDLKCGNNDYYKRFVTAYSTDQFDIKFAPQFLSGTGNLIVDKILDGYKGNVFKPGII